MVSEEFFICLECKKKIEENAFKCPIAKKLVHKGCMHVHIHKCGSFHKKFTYWGAAAYKKKKTKEKEAICECVPVRKKKTK